MAAHLYPARSAVLPALLAALAGALRHWRLIVLGWLAGLLPAAFAAAPIRSLANQALGRDPDAARIVAGHDLEPVIEALLSLPDGGLGAGLSRFGLHASLALLIAALLAPWLAGMLVASLREGRALGFGELWSGGWREYGRQFRLLLVAIIPAALVIGLAMLLAAWVRSGQDTRILEAVGAQRQRIALWAVASAAALAWLGIETGRAAFARDPGLRSAFRAWRRGLRLLFGRPFAVLLVAAVTAATGSGIAFLLQKPMLAGAATGTALLLAQLAVAVLWWSRIARLTALTSVSPPPPDPAPAPAPAAVNAEPDASPVSAS